MSQCEYKDCQSIWEVPVRKMRIEEFDNRFVIARGEQCIQYLRGIIWVGTPFTATKFDSKERALNAISNKEQEMSTPKVSLSKYGELAEDRRKFEMATHMTTKTNVKRWRETGEFDRSRNHSTTTVESEDGDFIAIVYGRSKADAQKTGRLIAAAPQLLEIAQEIANDSRCDLVDSERRIRLYAALTKAGAL